MVTKNRNKRPFAITCVLLVMNQPDKKAKIAEIDNKMEAPCWVAPTVCKGTLSFLGEASQSIPLRAAVARGRQGFWNLSSFKRGTVCTCGRYDV